MAGYPVKIAGFDITNPQDTPHGWKFSPPQPMLYSTVVVNNQTGSEFDIYGDANDAYFLGTIPSGAGNFHLAIEENLSYLEFRPTTSVQPTGTPPTTFVNGIQYPNGVTIPATAPVSYIRQVNVGGGTLSVPTQAQELIQNAGDTQGIVTNRYLINTYWGHGASSVAPLQQGTGALAIIGQSFNGSVYTDDIAWNDGHVIIGATGNTQGAGGGIIDRYGGENLVGRGVPVMRALMENVTITDTNIHAIQLTSPNDGAQHTYRIGGYFIVNNVTSPSVLSVQVLFTDATGTRTDTLMSYFSTGTVFPNGINTIANGHYQIPSITPTINPNTVITARYIANNAPNDRVTLYIERLT